MHPADPGPAILVERLRKRYGAIEHVDWLALAVVGCCLLHDGRCMYGATHGRTDFLAWSQRALSTLSSPLEPHRRTACEPAAILRPAPALVPLPRPSRAAAHRRTRARTPPGSAAHHSFQSRGIATP